VFIDEIHTLVGSGGGDGAMDAANILKPALARGELRAIGTTTLKEYQNYFERDKALERRFQIVVVDEPSPEDAISILRGLKERYESHHRVQIKDDAVIAAVELSHRYISDRFLPDKAIDLLDEAAAKMRMEINSMPEELDEAERKIKQLEIEREAIKREKDDEKAMVRIDMSEYQEKHTVSRLIGAPPGYIGYDEGGQLTEAVRRKPYSVILLDEIEKAHPDVFNILLQVLDDGRLTDNKGRTADFRNTIIVMTSNLGSALIQSKLEKLNNGNRDRVLEESRLEVMELLRRTLRPEFLNRIDEVIVFTPLTEAEIRQIVVLQIERVNGLMAESGVKLMPTSGAIDRLAAMGYDPQYGARPVKRLIQRNLLNELSKKILAGDIPPGTPVVVDVEGDHFGFRSN
jgi:ATP-dependent Clp protease ATP-binding subunit ClpA